jgi:hypothetical protein
MMKSWRSSNDGGTTAVLVAVVAALSLLVVAHLVVPCAGQQCGSALASVPATGTTDVVPTIGQRILIGGSAVTISTVTFSALAGACRVPWCGFGSAV